MNSLNDNFNQAIALIQSSKKILLVSHRRPDGDTLGATVALAHALVQLGKTVVPACMDQISSRLTFISDALPQGMEFVREFEMDDYDLMIISDAGASHMTGFQERYEEFLSNKLPIINIDHHASNDNFGVVNCVDAQASSATVMVYRLLKLMGTTFNQSIALALLAGIYNDTGGFMHSNTNQETFEIAGDLTRYDVPVSQIVKPMFKQSSMAQLKLWGHLLEKMQKNDKDVVSSVVTRKDLSVVGADASDTGGIIDLMSTVKGARFTILLTEDRGVVKGSLRTQRDDVDVNKIAQQFGGGGHMKASGFRMHGRLEQHTVWKIAPADGTPASTTSSVELP
ncbi:hypothetical protein CO046_05200 [Candidatus Peregrinibacteria bacterium CG_4_9_14_0_2_um_filter_53_11]|nr:MAG: hypothetical protein CO046_05200 [Candidatus Peregrinibacteria bacterium CG_4_9_14_0_2_um_filter_53_11]